MRFVALVVIMLSIPVFMTLYRQNARYRRYMYFALGFMPFLIAGWNLDAAFISWAAWPGQTKGVIISLLDAMALGIILASRARVFTYPFVGIILAYLLSAALSIFFADNPQAAFFYVWQLGTVLLVFMAVATVCRNEAAPRLIIAGLVCGIALQAGVATSQKLSGVVQASGTLGHQNLLGMVTHFVLYPSLALLLASNKSKLPLLGVASALIVVASGASRATIGFAGIGVVLLIGLSMIRKPSARKTRAAIAGLLVLAIATPVALASLEQRFAISSAEGSSEERQAFERAAAMILADNPMGVGANQYVVVANTRGYSEEAGVIWNYASRSAKVHNAYLLVAAETGYLGLVCFMLFLFVPIFAALRFAWQNRGDPRGDLALGIGVAMFIVSLHCLYEWVLVTASVQYMIAINLGILGGLILQRKAEKRAAILERKKISESGRSGKIPAMSRKGRRSRRLGPKPASD
ncbi:O-antigen ligase [Parasphingorhabdus marina DSM 22363]|uniref:O-antigen ligase n=1 Tax=Parasphingorhabdus marina DSM 22363 TaxID=1123272 RepID=A0A1N6CPN1_9SPHN|nr:O-antigen ligase family protein [Parasphingorhabdus marina]SIN60513.1 O-antigen ligase [Parasphingorhabdus marina DSM 22363]